MSRKIYICKNILDANVYCAGNSIASTVSFGSTAADAVGETITNDPFQVLLCKEVQTAVDSATINAVNIQSARLIDWKLSVYNINKSLDYKASRFYKEFLGTTTLTFNVYINYKKNDVTYRKIIQVSTLSKVITDQGYFEIAINATFPNVYESAPLTSISVDTAESAAVSYTNGTEMSSSEAIVCMQMTANMHPSSLRGIITKGTGSTSLFSSINLPYDSDFKRPGRIYVTYFEIMEIGKAHCLYPYKNASNTEIKYWHEPSTGEFYRDSNTIYDVYEFDSATPSFRNSSSHISNLVGSYGDNVSSSFDDSTMYRPDYYNQDDIDTFSSWSTGVTWDYLRYLAWLDGVKILFRWNGSDAGNTGWILSLGDLIKTGFQIPAGATQITSVEIVVPDLCTLTPIEFTDSPSRLSTSDFLGGFYPYNRLQLSLRLGYQTDATGTVTSAFKQGLYHEAHRIRRMIVDATKEIEYFVVDEEE